MEERKEKERLRRGRQQNMEQSGNMVTLGEGERHCIALTRHFQCKR